MSVPPRLTFTVGVCAYNEERRLSHCLESLLSQAVPVGSELQEVLVVASGCTDGTEAVVEEWMHRDPRVELIKEDRRIGKASAINQILSRARGDVIVLLNADARLRAGAIASLLEPFLLDPRVEIACGAPVPGSEARGIVRLIVECQWGIHNRTLDSLSRLALPNHCCDELLAMRRGFVTALPLALVNDGAYLGVEAALRGLSVRFCPNALVEVEIPSHIHGVMLQRRRILRGHRQVREMLHRPPNTLEAIFPTHPALALRIVRAEIFRHPRTLLSFLFLLLPLETAAGGLSSFDRVRSAGYETVWIPVQ